VVSTPRPPPPNWRPSPSRSERRRTLDLQPLPRPRMFKLDRLRVQHEPFAAAAVEPVAEDRGAEAEPVRGVDLQLVRPSRHRKERDARRAIVDPPRTSLRVIARRPCSGSWM
jgi:hypothetical protein